MKVNLKINNELKEVEIHPGEILLETLRRIGYKGVKKGCMQGECGACTILLNNEAVNSCLVLTADAEGMDIVTIEGIGDVKKPDVLQIAFVETGAVQCGYCTPGMILSSKALLDKNPHPTEKEIKKALDGNYCRCTGYVKIIEAVKVASNKIKKK